MTGAVPATLKFPAVSVPFPAGLQTDTRSRIVLTGYAAPPYVLTATDLSANILWYYPWSPIQLTRPVPSGTILVIANGPGTGTGVWGNVTAQQLLREIDLAGNTVRETNCDRVYEQLTAMGLTDPLGRFNHDAIRLSNGQTIVLGDVQRIFPAGTQGSTRPVDIIGALIIVLDQNFQVIRYWNAFDHDCADGTCLNVNRKAVRGETCSPGRAGCPPALLLPTANDWLHANSLEYLTQDGDLLVSLRDQDWVVKIDYNNGTGTGGILWRLGLAGDFALSGSNDPYPWFSAQHDAGFVNNQELVLSVFDNAVSRHAQFGGNSRGQVYKIDQANMTASLQLSADLGVYSWDLGSAQLSLNGDYMFQPGNILAGTTVETQSTELTSGGSVAYQFQALGSVSYRGWRLTDFYHALPNGSSGPQ